MTAVHSGCELERARSSRRSIDVIYFSRNTLGQSFASGVVLGVCVGFLNGGSIVEQGLRFHPQSRDDHVTLFPFRSSRIYLDEKKRPKSRPANVAPKVRIEIER